MKKSELRHIIREMIESMRVDPHSVSKKLDNKKINGWEAEFQYATGGIVWYNDKYIENDDPIWVIESSPFYDGDEFTMNIHHLDTSDFSDVAIQKIKPSGNDAKDLKAFVNFFKKNVVKAEKMIKKNTKK